MRVVIKWQDWAQRQAQTPANTECSCRTQETQALRRALSGPSVCLKKREAFGSAVPGPNED